MLSTNIYPILLTWKKPGRDGSLPLYLAVDVNNKRAATKTLKRKVHPLHWDSEKKELRSEAPNAELINRLIRKEREKLDADLTRKELLGLAMTREAVRKVVKGLDTGADFYAFCRSHIRNEKNEDNVAYAEGTVRLYTYEIAKMEAFCPTVSFRDIDTAFIRRYCDWMKHKRANRNNTIWKSLKFLRTMLNAALRAKIYIAANPMEDFAGIAYSEPVPDYTEWKDVQKLYRKIKDNPGIELTAKKVGYSYVLSCHTGLRFSDVIEGKGAKRIISGAEGKRLLLRTKKTGEIVSIPFTDEISELMSWLADHPLSISNQKYNEHLKTLSGIAEVPTLRSHMGRHTFGMHCAELGMSIDDVQELMGHTKREMTMRYFRIKGPRLDKAMEAWKKPANEDAHIPD